MRLRAYFFPDNHLQMGLCCCAQNSNPYNISINVAQVTVYIPPGGELLRHAHHGQRPAERDLHGLLDQLSDLLELDLRGRRDVHRPESEPLLHHRGQVHGGADGDECRWLQHLTKTNYITVSGDFTANSATLDSGTNISGTYTNTQACGRGILGGEAGPGQRANDARSRDLHHEHRDEQSLAGDHHGQAGARRFPPARSPQKIYLYNNSTSAWDLEDTTHPLTEYPEHLTVTSAANYMSSGTVKVRVFVGGNQSPRTTRTH